MNSSPALVLHAAGLDAQAADFLGLDGARVTLPGHGGRQRRPDLTLGEMVDEIVGWVHEPVHVIGLSMGGMVAQHLALTHPDRVRSLVLACTTAKTPRKLLIERAEATEKSARAQMVETTLNRWFTADFLTKTPVPPGVTYARACLERIDPAAFADVWRAIAAHDLLDRVHEITAPTTCLAGTHDVSTPPTELAELAAQIPGARLVEIEVPHMALLERPSEFRRVVNDHIDWAESS